MSGSLLHMNMKSIGLLDKFKSAQLDHLELWILCHEFVDAS
jgi:hypothetical protein